MTAGLSDSAVSGPSAALPLARGICRALDQLGYASLTVNRLVNGLGPNFLVVPNAYPNRGPAARLPAGTARSAP